MQTFCIIYSKLKSGVPGGFTGFVTIKVRFLFLKNSKLHFVEIINLGNSSSLVLVIIKECPVPDPAARLFAAS